MNSMMSIIKFTFANKVKSKAFLIVSIILALIITIGANLPYLIESFSSDAPTKIGVFNNHPDITNKLDGIFKAGEKPELQLVTFPDGGSAEANDKIIKGEIAAKKIKGFLDLTDVPDEDFPKAVYKSEETMGFGTKSTLQNALQAIKSEYAVQDLGLTEDQLKQMNAPVSFESRQISVSEDGGSGKTERELEMAYVLVYALLFLIFIGVMTSGQLIATEITAEKSSRVMELLISSVNPLKLMFGKIIGIGLVALIQIALFITVSLINISLPHNIQQLGINFNDIPTSMIIYFFLFYVLGFFLYATLFAAIGSLVSRTEDLGQAVMPVTFLTIAGFYIALYGLSNPTSSFVIIMSFVPFFSPMIMFLRIGMSDPDLWEIILSLIILVASVWGMGWIAAKIYRTGVLMYGKRPSFKELRKAMKAYKI